MADEFKFEWDQKQFEAIRARYAKISLKLRELNPTLLRAGVAALGEFRRRITTGGDGTWAPNAGYNALLRNEGTLIRSLQLGGGSNVNRLTDTSIEVGSALPYARMLQEGTGIYGPKGTPIVPINGKFLVFTIGGQLVFARSVKGTPPRRFVYFDDELKATVKKILKTSFFDNDVENASFT